MRFNVVVNGYFELSEEELLGCSNEDIQKFIQDAQESTKQQMLSEVEDINKAHFDVKITI